MDYTSGALLAMAGKALLWLSLLASAAAFVLGWARRERPVRWLLVAATAALLAASGLLLSAFLRNDFRFEYVAGHSSSQLAVPYRVAALWAGQEGSVLFWTVLVALVAWRLAAAPSAVERAAGGRLAGLLAGMVALLLIRGPFVLLPVPPADGNGLNPLLHNPWMCIHPPVLFLGYALLAAPFALALVALRHGDQQAWLAPARAYLLAGWVFLGAGMMLGGYWAYITLGWGGFWAWDPVENASLIPWLVATAMLHSVAVQVRSGAMARMNLALATITLAAVVYGSYLTRSGVLAGASVHNFESLGGDYNAAWLLLLAVPTAAGLVPLLRRPATAETAIPPGQTWLANGAWLILAMAAVVLVGTSMPLISGWTGQKTAVDASFYDRTQSLLFALLTVVLVLQLKPAQPWLRALVATGALLSGLAVARQVPDGALRWGLVVLSTGCGAMVVLGAWRAADGWSRGHRRGVGSGLAHAGAALMVLGAVLSGPGQRVASVSLGEGETSATLGFEVTLVALEPLADGRRLVFAADGSQAAGEIRETSHGELRTPALIHRPWGDLYLEPVQIEQSAGRVIELSKGESTELGDGVLTFSSFAMGGTHGEGGMAVGAALSYQSGEATHEATPQFIIGEGGATSPPTALGPYQVSLVQVSADTGSVALSLSREGEPGGRSKVLVQVTRKPHIGWVWLGTILCLGGGAWCLWGPAGRRKASEG